MSNRTIQDILPLVETPSRYLGSEVNAIKKDPQKVELHIALAFPDMYEIGTSHFGIQILYHILNSHKSIAAERVFAPGIDMETHLRSAGIPIVSLESRRPLGGFDIIGFSLLYELNYTNILTILELAKIPFFARERSLSYPLVIGGGPCTCNPEPVADIFDAMVVGDGESVILEMSHAWMEWKASGGIDKNALLTRWSEIEGVYIPTFFEPEYDQRGRQKLLPKFDRYQKVKRAIVEDLDRAPFPDRPIIPFGKPVHDRLRLEISRGCTRGCRFCQAGMIYRPVRERSMEALMALTEAAVASTGYEDLSLLSLSTGDYGCIAALMEQLMANYASRNIAVSLPSLRAGTLTPELMTLIKKVRKTGFTIAPEAGSERLRSVINKNISEADIIDTVRDAFEMGWQVIKLYFMVGLPTETRQDLQAIVDLVKTLRKIKVKSKKNKKINVSVATFIPKPHTPFQWAPQISLEESKERIRWLQRSLKMPGVQLKWQNPEMSLLEGLWSRGDRRLSRLLVAAYRKGCRFDGWSDKFDYGSWLDVLDQEGVDIDFYTTRSRDKLETLPWDHIDTGVAKNFLDNEREKAVKGEPTADCCRGDCNVCGVCDFDRIEPIAYEACRTRAAESLAPDRPKEAFYKTLIVEFSKRGPARHFGHLELVSIFLRAARRAEVPMKFSEGFHPKPRISFQDPLPVGLESLREHFYLDVSGNLSPQTIVERLNFQLPEGLRVLDCRLAGPKSLRSVPAEVSYLITKKDGFFDEKELKGFMSSSELVYKKTNRKGKTRELDLKDLVSNIELVAPDRLQMTLRNEPGKTVRPLEVMGCIFNLSGMELKQAEVIKIN
jgi:radical SAM family uncharacterized protein/radical SAM-linked protein